MNTPIQSTYSSYELSHTQKRFWFMDQLDFSDDPSARSMSHVSAVLTLTGALQISSFQQALYELGQRHSALRTCYADDNGEPIQLVFDECPIPLHVMDMSADHDQQALKQHIQEQLNATFDLRQAPLMRCILYKLSDHKHTCLIVAHHSIADGLSVDILLADLMSLYRAAATGIPHRLPALDIQYSDYAHWHNGMLQNGEMKEQQQFWQHYLSGELPDLNFPIDYQRPPERTYAGSAVPLVIPADSFEQLKKTCEQLDVSLYMFLLGVMNVVLAKYTRNRDIIVGTSLSGRFHPDLNRVIGSFINTLPVRNRLDGKQSFHEFVLQIKRMMLDVQENQAYPFDKIAQDLGVERNNSRHPIYDVVFEMHALHADSKEVREVAPDLFLSFEHSLQPIRYSAFDFAFELYQKEGMIEGYIQYASDLFAETSMERLSRNFIQLASQAAANPAILIGEMDMLSAEEHAEVLEHFNEWTVPFPVDQPFPLLFEEQVRQTPNHIAASFAGVTMTYAELNARANQLAHLLRSLHIGKGHFVAVMSDRNLDWLTALIGILKSGAAYVPIDTNVPDERATYILQDCEAELLITESHLLTRATALCHESGRSVLCMDAPSEAMSASFPQLIEAERLEQYTTDNPLADEDAARLAYMIYTSGSTGVPKGALVRHNGMINHLYAKIVSLELNEQDIVAQNASISFDVSIWQSLVALLVGGQTSIISFETGRDQALLFQHMQEHHITIIETVPSLLFAFLDTVQTMDAAQQSLPALRWMIANGEELPSKLVKSWFERFPAIPLINAYGPTECSDDVTQYAMYSCVQDGYDLMQNRIPIGRPLPNMRLYVVDQFHKLVPVGVKGEIWIAGIGVGAGYWHNEELTNSKFIANPFARHEHERTAYRTGDLGCWLSSGHLEFSSRIDYQVKVRGFRIELGEVETVVNHHPDVDEAAVITRKQTNGDFMLIAFYTSQKQLLPEQLRLYLQQKLPYYMVPAQLVAIERMPLLASEKIDRKQLQAQAADYVQAGRSGKAALETDTERELAALWADVLEQDEIFADDHFFHLGGHSISAVKLVNRIREQYGISMPLQQIFAAPVLQDLAVAIEHIRNTQHDGELDSHERKLDMTIQPAATRDAYALAPVQLPEWYLHELEPDSSFYNVSFDLMFYGEMDVAAFVQAWQHIVDRHSVLRTYFDKQQDTPVQRIHPRLSLQINDVYEDRRDTDMGQFEQEVRQTALEHSNQIFDFARGPLFSIKLIEYPQQQFLLMFAAHHIIWDETSSMNVINELSELYNAQIEQRPSSLQPLSVQYSDYAEWMNGLIEQGALESNRRYWLERFKQAPPALNLPTDYARPSVMTFNGDTILTTIEPDLQKRIADYCQQQGITLYMFLLSVLHLQLHRLSGQDYFAVGSPIANRNAMQLEPMLGLFASAIPLSCTIKSDMTFAHLMEQGKQTAIEAYDNHLYPGNLLIEQIQTENDLSRSKLFSVMYGLQNNKQTLVKNLSFTGLDYNTRVYDFLETSSRFDLTFAFDELGDGIELNLNYNTDLFKRSTALRIAEQFMLLARQVVDAPNRLLHEYDYLDNDSKAVLSVAQQLVEPEQVSDNVCNLIEQQADRCPEQAAIRDASGIITYRQMNERANQLAHRLLEQGVQPEQKIGVSLTRSADLIIAMLAVWKAGAAYVAIPLDMPEERRSDIVRTAEITTIIADSSVQVWCESLQLMTFQPVSDDEQSVESVRNPALPIGSHQLAYVLFTSGTTGRPKGIEIEHGGIVHLFTGLQQRYQLKQEDRALFHTSYAFDASLLELFWPLTYGASLYIPQPELIGNPAEIGKIAAQQQITFLQFVPLMLDEFVRAGQQGAFTQWSELRFVISGGAALNRKQCENFKQQFTCSLYNHYGPTEVTVDATVFDCSLPFEGDIVPIGTALPYVRLYILDAMMQQVPIGVPGELYIESPALARGYMNDPQRTTTAFVKHPFNVKSEARLYKTGDIVKWLEQGVVSYIGRADQQVKVRGNRVELEEIEALLAQHADISSAAVLHRHTESYDDLIAYVEIAKHAQPLEQRGLKWFNLSQMPQLIEGMNKLHRQSWPEYFIGDAVMLEHWPKLFGPFADYQFALLQEDGQIAAIGNTVPVYWDGTPEHLPIGWDDGLLRAVQPAQQGQKPNTLLVLAGVVDEQQQGKGLSGILLEAFKHTAQAQQLEHIIIPVRPTGKTNHPNYTFAQYCDLHREDGLPVDPWLRTHIRAGGRILGIADKSQMITGSVADWQKWTGISFAVSGSYPTTVTLQPVEIDLEQNRGVYYDPSVWVQHTLPVSEQTIQSEKGLSLIHKEQLTQQLRRRLPAYMVPQTIMFVASMPLNDNGKVDKNKLLATHTIETEVRDIVLPQNEEEQHILSIWQEVLQLEDISVTDNFFELGGHSLKATAVVARINAALHCNLSLRELFEQITIRHLANHIRTMRSNANSSVSAAPAFKKVERRERSRK